MNLLNEIWKRSSILFKVVIALLLLYLFSQFHLMTHSKEGYSNAVSLNYKTHTGDNVYDKFYVGIYDDILHNSNRMKFETNTILKYPSSHGKLLDVGSGTGHLVNVLKNSMHCIGVDKSLQMIRRAQYNYPENDYIQQNVLESMLFSPNYFTHITCFYFTIYYIRDKQLFFENCNKWLVPKGYLFIHLVDKANFASDIDEDNFDVRNYRYKMKYVPKTKDVSLFRETFQQKEKGHIRKNEHTLYMNSQSEILGYAKKARFDLVEMVDMRKCDFKYHYLYVLQKNN